MHKLSIVLGMFGAAAMLLLVTQEGGVEASPLLPPRNFFVLTTRAPDGSPGNSSNNRASVQLTDIFSNKLRRLMGLFMGGAGGGGGILTGTLGLGILRPTSAPSATSTTTEPASVATPEVATVYEPEPENTESQKSTTEKADADNAGYSRRMDSTLVVDLPDETVRDQLAIVTTSEHSSSVYTTTVGKKTEEFASTTEKEGNENTTTFIKERGDYIRNATENVTKDDHEDATEVSTEDDVEDATDDADTTSDNVNDDHQTTNTHNANGYGYKNPADETVNDDDNLV